MNKCLIYLVFCFFSLALNAQSNTASSAATIIEPSFMTSYLSHQHLMAFQNRALQKAEDIEEYLKVVRSFEYEKSLREQAGKMLLAFFVEDAQITFESFADTVNRQVSVRDFVQELLDKDENSIQVSPKTINNKRLETPLSLHKSGHYVGLISYTVIDEEDSDFLSERNIVIHLQKVGRAFGGLKEDVWEVKLGNVVVR